MAAKSRYLVGQKLSDYHVEKIIRTFAYGHSASTAVKSAAITPASPGANSIFTIYDLTRRRLLELGYFPDPDAFDEYAEQPEVRFTEAYARTEQLIFLQKLARRGYSKKTKKYHMAEIIFRAENYDYPPAAIFRDIKLAIKITGPLNRPPANLEVWGERLSIMLYQRKINSARRKLRDDNPSEALAKAYAESIASHEEMIAEAETRLRQMQRPGWKEKPKLPEQVGRCLCGQVFYTVKGKPLTVVHCYCRDCQMGSGAGHLPRAIFPKKALSIIGDVTEYQHWTTEKDMTKAFCPVCGTVVFTRNNGAPTYISIFLGTLKNPSAFKPQMSLHTCDRIPWDSLDESLPAHETLPDVELKGGRLVEKE